MDLWAVTCLLRVRDRRDMFVPCPGCPGVLQETADYHVESRSGEGIILNRGDSTRPRPVTTRSGLDGPRVVPGYGPASLVPNCVGLCHCQITGPPERPSELSEHHRSTLLI